MTHARNANLHVLTHEVEMQDLWVVFPAHCNKENNIPARHTCAHIAMAAYTAKQGEVH